MLQDISEYKKCSKKFRSSTVEQLFSILHALVNLLVVVPDNLRQVITEGHLVCRRVEKMMSKLLVFRHH